MHKSMHFEIEQNTGIKQFKNDVGEVNWQCEKKEQVDRDNIALQYEQSKQGDQMMSI